LTTKNSGNLEIDGLGKKVLREPGNANMDATSRVDAVRPRPGEKCGLDVKSQEVARSI
jgi:hypothetical protein